MSKILIDSGPSERGFHYYESILRCGQLFAWKHRAGKNIESDHERAAPLVRGSIGHTGLAHLYAKLRAIQRGEDPGAYYSPLEAMQLVAEKFGTLGVEHLPKVTARVKDYASAYANDGAHYKVVGVEEPARTHFGPALYTARIDLEVEDAAGYVWIVDHKFTAKIEAKTFSRYTLSGQFLGLQLFGVQKYADRFGGVWLNVIGMDGRFARRKIDPAPFRLRRFPEDIAAAHSRIEELDSKNLDPTSWPASPSEMTCYTPYGPCEFFERCRWGNVE